jgi:AAA+ ATPase superfamily predicted ATPase
VAVLGPRRIGKTSLILTFLNEWSVPNIFIDCRKVLLSSYGASFRGFAEELSRALIAFISSHKGIASKLLEYLRSVRGVEVDLNMAKASLRWSRRDRIDIVSLLERLNDFAREESWVTRLST